MSYDWIDEFNNLPLVIKNNKITLGSVMDEAPPEYKLIDVSSSYSSIGILNLIKHNYIPYIVENGVKWFFTYYGYADGEFMVFFFNPYLLSGGGMAAKAGYNTHSFDSVLSNLPFNYIDESGNYGSTYYGSNTIELQKGGNETK